MVVTNIIPPLFSIAYCAILARDNFGICSSIEFLTLSARSELVVSKIGIDKKSCSA